MREVFNFSFLSVFMSVIYSVALLLILFLLQGKSKLKHSSIIGVTVGFSMFYAFFVLNYIVGFKSISPDSYMYSSIIKNFWNSYDSWSIGVQLYSLINYVPIKLCFGYPSLFILFNIFYYFAGVTLIGRAFSIYLSTNNIVVSRNFLFYLFVFSTLYPIGIIIIPSLLREGSMIFFLGLTTYYLVVIYSNKKIFTKYLIYFTISLVLLTLIRPIGGITYITAIFILYFFEKLKMLNLKQFLILSIGITIFTISIYYIVNLFYNLPFSAEWLADYRKGHISYFGNESYGGKLNFQSLGEIIESSFLLFNQYLFSPLPIIIPTDIMLKKIIPTLDTLFIIGLIIPTLLQLDKNYLRKIILFAGVLLFIPALFETHISGAYRHRMNGIIILMPVFVYSFNRFLIEIVKKFKTK